MKETRAAAPEERMASGRMPVGLAAVAAPAAPERVDVRMV
jgi:hypothetical protein